jgi:ABC-type Zn uptake system ZnuABC Zn-binding protein ZnuA
MAEMRPRIEALPNRKVLVVGDDFSALTAPLGIQQFRPVDSPATRLTDDDLRRLREAIRTERLGTMLISEDVPAALREDLARRLELQALTIDSLGTSAPTGRNSYLGVLRYDLEQLTRIR